MSLTVAPPLGVVLLVLCMSWAPVHGASQAASTTPVVAVPGPRTLGDPFYPTLGNGGYDVQAYDLDLTWHPPDAVHPQGWVDGIVDIDLRPTEDLSDLSIDLTRSNSHVTGVTIDGHSVEHRPDVAGQKFIVIPDDVLMAGTQVRVRVAWTATPLGVNRLGEELPLAGARNGADRSRPPPCARFPVGRRRRLLPGLAAQRRPHPVPVKRPSDRQGAGDRSV